jgi:hypothetical protein
MNICAREGLVTGPELSWTVPETAQYVSLLVADDFLGTISRIR